MSPTLRPASGQGTPGISRAGCRFTYWSKSRRNLSSEPYGESWSGTVAFNSVARQYDDAGGWAIIDLQGGTLQVANGMAGTKGIALLIVEPFAGATVAENLTPVGRVYYSFSTFLCVPHAISEGATDALGNQAGEAVVSDVVGRAGFGDFQRVAQTPFNLVYAARP